MTSIRTPFAAEEHGFRFVNRFDFSVRLRLPFTGPIDLGRVVYGLCGGMCFAALDYFHAGRAIPSHARREDLSPGFLGYLWERQLDSLSLPVIPRVAQWMLLEDAIVGELTAYREIPRLCGRLHQGLPTVIALLRARGLEGPTKNHQVLATGYDLDATTQHFTLHVYDPNHPGQVPTLTFNLAQPWCGLKPAQSTGEPLRGLFVIEYAPGPPPEVETTRAGEKAALLA
jgi:hypothetical protein